ncbi:MAG: hypothetical protein ACI83B_003597 [Sediminicola sp.]|jgi:hypothetical protein
MWPCSTVIKDYLSQAWDSLRLKLTYQYKLVLRKNIAKHVLNIFAIYKLQSLIFMM